MQFYNRKHLNSALGLTQDRLPLTIPCSGGREALCGKTILVLSLLLRVSARWRMRVLKHHIIRLRLLIMSILLCFLFFLELSPTEINYISCMKALSSNKQIAAVQVTLSVSAESRKRSCFLPFSRLRFSPSRLLFQAVFWFVLNSLNLGP